MHAIRRIVTAKDIVMQVLLPKTFRNKRLEVIILPTDDISDMSTETKKFDFTSLYGKLKSGMSIEAIDQKLKQI